jgi:hypothetical protein
MINWRNRITVDGVPGTWTTNLSDDDVRDFYARYAEEPANAQELKVGVMHLVCGFKFHQRMVPFRHGACDWTLLHEQNWVLYRTTFEWEIWLARKQEVVELKEEQENERAATILLIRTESDHLMRAAREAVRAKDFPTAERYLITRAELALDIERLKLSNWWSYGIIENISHWFTSFPSLENGIEFLRTYSCRAESFLDYAAHSAFGGQLPHPTREVELEKVFDAAAELFPTDGHLFKQTCLFWRRHARLDLAIKYCEIAAERGLSDDTKLGFAGRLVRLRREEVNKQMQAASAVTLPMNFAA